MSYQQYTISYPYQWTSNSPSQFMGTEKLCLSCNLIMIVLQVTLGQASICFSRKFQFNLICLWSDDLFWGGVRPMSSVTEVRGPLIVRLRENPKPRAFKQDFCRQKSQWCDIKLNKSLDNVLSQKFPGNFLPMHMAHMLVFKSSSTGLYLLFSDFL